MYFRKAEELARYLIDIDNREWGELRGFSSTPDYRYYFWDIMNKFVRGKSVLLSNSPEFYAEKEKAIRAFANWIKNNTKVRFPLDYSSECTYADGHFTYFDVKYEYNGQVTIEDLLEGQGYESNS